MYESEWKFKQNFIATVDIVIALVGIVTKLRLDNPGWESPVGARDFSLLQNFRLAVGAHLVSCSVDTVFFSLSVSD